MKGAEMQPQYMNQPVVQATVVQGLPVEQDPVPVQPMAVQAIAVPAVQQPVVVQAVVPAQPMIVQPVPVAGLQPVPLQGTPPSEWSQGICGCFSHKDCGCNCCIASTCCACFFYPALEQEAQVPNGFGGYAPTCCALSGIPDAALGAVGCPPVIGALARYFLRRGTIKKYNIQEGECASCCFCFWCGWCALCQQTNEMMTRKHLLFDGPFKVKEDPGPRPPISMDQVPGNTVQNRF